MGEITKFFNDNALELTPVERECASSSLFGFPDMVEPPSTSTAFACEINALRQDGFSPVHDAPPPCGSNNSAEGSVRGRSSPFTTIQAPKPRNVRRFPLLRIDPAPTTSPFRPAKLDLDQLPYLAFSPPSPLATTPPLLHNPTFKENSSFWKCLESFWNHKGWFPTASELCELNRTEGGTDPNGNATNTVVCCTGSHIFSPVERLYQVATQNLLIHHTLEMYLASLKPTLSTWNERLAAFFTVFYNDSRFLMREFGVPRGQTSWRLPDWNRVVAKMEMMKNKQSAVAVANTDAGSFAPYSDYDNGTAANPELANTPFAPEAAGRIATRSQTRAAKNQRIPRKRKFTFRPEQPIASSKSKKKKRPQQQQQKKKKKNLAHWKRVCNIVVARILATSPGLAEMQTPTGGSSIRAYAIKSAAV